MKTFFYSLLLSTLFIAPAWAEAPADQPAEEEHGISIKIDMDDDDASNEDSGKALEKKIKSKVLSIVSDIIEAADKDLSEDEKQEMEEEIEQALEDIGDVGDDLESSHDIRIGGDEPIALQLVLGAMAIFFLFGTPIMIIAAVLYSSYRKKRLMHETINQYVTSGKDIPDEVLKGLQKEATPKSNLHRGLIMSGIGLGIFASFAVIGTMEAAALGLIPFFIGLAQLLIWKLEK